MRTFLWFANFIIYQCISIFFLIKYKILIKAGKIEKAQKYLYNITSRWARNMIKATGSKVIVEGLDNIPENDTVLFVSNHQGNFDIPLLIGYLPKSVGFIAKVELKKIPMVKTWMEKLHCVFMDRKNPKESLKAILKGIDYLKKGSSMVVFPEGTRSKSNILGEFKAGSMKLALKSGVKIVPITINGTYRIMEETKKIKPAKITLCIHSAIDTTLLSNDEKKQLNEIVKTKIEEGII